MSNSQRHIESGAYKEKLDMQRSRAEARNKIDVIHTIESEIDSAIFHNRFDIRVFIPLYMVVFTQFEIAEYFRKNRFYVELEAVESTQTVIFNIRWN